ncbi:MAG: hypothetical protein QM500_02010 [Methylococcales bacterium]
MGESLNGIYHDDLRDLIKKNQITEIVAQLQKTIPPETESRGYAIFATQMVDNKPEIEVLIASTSKQIRIIKNPNTLSTTMKDLGVKEFKVDDSMT